MRLREFHTKESIGSQTGVGAALASASGKLAGLTIDYINDYYDWRKTTNAKEKEQKEKALKQKASKMSPQQKKDVKAQLAKQPEQPQKSTTPGKPAIGQIAYGTDGRTYKWAGQQWLSPTGAPKRKGVQVSVQ
jgi:hypothetical protein